MSTSRSVPFVWIILALVALVICVGADGQSAPPATDTPSGQLPPLPRFKKQRQQQSPATFAPSSNFIQQQQPGTPGYPEQQPKTNPPKYDPAYEKLARGSGGQVLYLDRNEAGKAMQLIEATQNRETILVTHNRTAPATVEFPVDSFTKTIYVTLSASEPGTDIKVFRPSGRPVEEGPVSVHMTRLTRGMILAIDVPESGLWRVEFAPRGVASLAVTAKTDLFVATFQFVELKGRIGHAGLMPIDGMPAAGHRMTAEFTASDNTLASAEVALVSEDLREFHETKFKPVEGGEYLGILRVPEEPFRVIVRGTDANGARYQRMYTPLFTPQKE